MIVICGPYLNSNSNKLLKNDLLKNDLEYGGKLEMWTLPKYLMTLRNYCYSSGVIIVLES